jgi:hypothetical protein
MEDKIWLTIKIKANIIKKIILCKNKDIPIIYISN